MKDKTLTYEGHRSVNNYAYLRHGASVLIEKSEKEPTGSYFTIMSALIMTAFTFEAYLNHVGYKKVSFWESIDRVSVLKKYDVINKLFDRKIDTSKRPEQTLIKLFSFRNSVAHARTEEVSVKKIIKIEDQHNATQHEPKTKIEEYCTLNNAKMAFEDISSIITDLHNLTGVDPFPFDTGMGSYGLSLNTDEH